jgi:hypothetical protein
VAPGISSATDFLRAAVMQYLAINYSNPPMKCDESIDAALRWVPTISCSVNHQLMLIEVSEKPYPEILRMRRAEMAEVLAPIAAYAACPEEAYSADQREALDLRLHGFGLFTVDRQGLVTCKFPAIPIAQHIPEIQFRTDIDGLPAIHKRNAKECFDLYKVNAPAGVASIAEQLEAMVMRAARDALKKGWIKKDKARGPLASVLLALQSCPNLKNADTTISTLRAFVSKYRNAAHHPPKNKKQSFIKYRDCRHGFLDGLRHMRDFRDALRQAGLSGGFLAE